MENKIIEREIFVTNKLSEIFAEWTELKIKILCREEEIRRRKRDLNVVMFCFSVIIICLLILLIIGVK